MADPTRVLVVDDHHMVAFGLGVALDGEPDVETVRHVTTVEAAMQAVADERPHVVLMDYHLPDGNGIDACRTLKRTYPGIVVLLVTGSADEWVFADAIQACDGFVDKAQPFDDLIAAVRAARDGRTVIPPDKLGTVLPLLKRIRPGGDLTKRELEVLQLMSDGLSNAQIAERLTLSVNTVRNHVHGILTKLHAHTKLEAVSTARRENVLGRGHRVR